jgi:hypothetical protein
LALAIDDPCEPKLWAQRAVEPSSICCNKAKRATPLPPICDTPHGETQSDTQHCSWPCVPSHCAKSAGSLKKGVGNGAD